MMFKSAWQQLSPNFKKLSFKSPGFKSLAFKGLSFKNHYFKSAGSALEADQFLPELNLQHLLSWQKYRSALGSHLKTPTSSTLAGQHRSRIQGRGMELSEIRNYQPGDDIRLMDWKVTARTRKPHTKVFLEEKERPVHLVIDLSSSMLFGSQRSKAEQAANIASTLGWSLTAQGDRCGGLIFNGQDHRLIRPKARQKGLLPLLQNLCQFGQQLSSEQVQAEPGRMNQILQQMIAQPGHGSLVVVISDFWSLDLEDYGILRQISRRHNLLAIQVSDPLEYELPPGPCYLTDGYQQQFFDGDKTQDKKDYRRSFDQHQQALQQIMLKTGGQFISLSTTEHPADKLEHYFS